MVTKAELLRRPVSGDDRIDALIDSTVQPWNFLGRNVLHYSFAVGEAGPGAANHLDLHSRSGFNGAQQWNTREALKYLSAVTGIQFAEVGDPAAADIHFANANLAANYTARAINGYRYTYTGEEVTSLTVDSWVYMDVFDQKYDNDVLTPGGTGYETLLHELGHVLGLKHPFEGEDRLTAGSGLGHDNRDTTLMSYTHSPGEHHTAYAPYDLAALQWLYGGDGLAGQWGVGGAAPAAVSVPSAAVAQSAGNDLLAGTLGQALRLYKAAFDRMPESAGLGYQKAVLDSGVVLSQVAAHFIASPEFSATFGALDDGAFVRQLYRNVLDREGEASGVAYHVASLAAGQGRNAVLVGFSESPENQQAVLVGLQDSGWPMLAT